MCCSANASFVLCPASLCLQCTSQGCSQVECVLEARPGLGADALQPTHAVLVLVLGCPLGRCSRLCVHGLIVFCCVNGPSLWSGSNPLHPFKIVVKQT